MKKYRDDERPVGKCYDCGMLYKDFPDMKIPDVLWEKINPTYHNGAGILCPTCIAKRLDEIDLWYSTNLYKLNYIEEQGNSPEFIKAFGEITDELIAMSDKEFDKIINGDF